MKRIGLIVNPIAGMGGSVGLKGTDGDMRRVAAKLGAKPVAPARTREFLSNLKHVKEITMLVAPGCMGQEHIEGLDIDAIVVGSIDHETRAEDTKRIATSMLGKGMDLLAFVGGDGTARNICDALDLKCPVVGIPSGVKVYSSVFGLSARAAAAMVDAFIVGAGLNEEEVLDIDESAFRRGVLDAKLYGYLLVPSVKQFLQAGKEASSLGTSNIESQKEIGEYVAESLGDEILYLLGPGTTVKAIATAIGIEKTLLGVDAMQGRELIAADLNETDILNLLQQHSDSAIIVTPLGGNGFLFGRGNRQFTPEVIRRIGKENIMVVATQDKLRPLNCLRVDTGDYTLDQELAGPIDVVVGYKYSKVMRIEC
ncbi:MAG: ATP-NAD kinase family protein [Arenicellales bacterium]|nr:ATP-NAD kinase family protein [Arenicellales bacterium]